jgi:hypothetical protein
VNQSDSFSASACVLLRGTWPLDVATLRCVLAVFFFSLLVELVPAEAFIA